jgi:hypothetical protein
MGEAIGEEEEERIGKNPLTKSQNINREKRRTQIHERTQSTIDQEK